MHLSIIYIPWNTGWTMQNSHYYIATHSITQYTIHNKGKENIFDFLLTANINIIQEISVSN
jgi:hypothetical protein